MAGRPGTPSASCARMPPTGTSVILGSVQRPDGKIVTVYYYNDRSAVERYIAATIWDPVL